METKLIPPTRLPATAAKCLGACLDAARNLGLHAVVLAAITLCLTKSNADPAQNQSALAKTWAASIQAEENKNYDDALDQVSSYQQQGGDKFMATLRTAWLCYLKKDYAEAAAFYARASQMQPNAINPLLGILNVAQAQKDATKIRAAAETILRIEPSNYRAQMALGGAAYAAKDYRGALASYMRVLVYYPDDTDATSGAAWSSYFLGDMEKAYAGFSKILSVNADYPYAQQGYSLTAGKKSATGLQTGSLQPGAGL
ncbi:MAG TPA: tetratricopeptide repeat protein [Chthoniobacteraceae bacterium]|nr:tetratricopeptide repeat protein [Chthoniobacteraceae bacterium]